MSLSLNSALEKELAKAGPVLVYRVDLGEDLVSAGGSPSSDTIGSFHWPNPGDAQLDYSQPLITRIGNIDFEIDPLTGDTAVSGCDIDLMPTAEVIAMLKDNRLNGKDFSVWLGTPNMVYSAWELCFRGVIRSAGKRGAVISIDAEAIDSEMKGTSGAIGRRLNETIPNGEASGVASIVNTAEAFSSSENPLLTIYYIIVNILDIPSRFYDSTALDYDTAANAAVKPYRCDRTATLARDNRLTSTESAWDVCREIAYMMGGQMLIREDGKLSFKIYDSSASSVYEFRDNRDIDGDIDASMRSEDIIGRLRLNTHWAQSSDGEGKSSQQYVAGFTLEETSTQGNWGFKSDASEAQGYDFEINDKWFGAAGVNNAAFAHSDASVLLNAFDNDADIVDNVTGAADYGMNWPGVGNIIKPGVGSTAITGVSATYPGYVVAYDDDNGDYAIFKFEASSLNTATKTVTLSSMSKVAGDNVSIAANAGRFYDITATYTLAAALMDRFSDGAVTAKFRSNMRPFKVQVFDLVTMSTDGVIAYGYDGSTGSDKFQVVRKSIVPEDFALEWTLLKATDTTPSLTLLDRFKDPSSDMALIKNPPELQSANDYGKFPNYFDPAVAAGGDAFRFTNDLMVVPGSGLAGAIPETRYILGGLARNLPAITHTFTASKDSYVFLHGSPTSRGRYTVSEVSNKAAKPATPSGSMPLMMVRTNGTDITQVVDMSNRGMAGTNAMALHERFSKYGEDEHSNTRVSGFTFTAAAGLTHDVAAGVAIIDGVRVERFSEEEKTFTASKDTYIDIDADGDYTYTAVANDAAEPALSSAKARILVVVTDGSDVTAVTAYETGRRAASKSLAARAIGAGFCPNALLDDIDAANAVPEGWSWTEGTDVTISVDATGAKAGRWSIKCDIPSTATTSRIYGPVFPVSPEQHYIARINYSNTGYSYAPKTWIGLQFYKANGEETSTRRGFVAQDATLTLDTSTEGAIEEGSFHGVGASQNQIPDDARFARWDIRIDAHATDDAGIYFSNFAMLPAVASSLQYGGAAQRSVATIGSWTDGQFLKLDAGVVTSAAVSTAQDWPQHIVSSVAEYITAIGSASAGDTIYMEAGTYEWSTTNEFEIPTGVTVIGAGVDQTVFTDDGTLDTANTAIWDITAATTYSYTINALNQYDVSFTVSVGGDSDNVQEGDMIRFSSSANSNLDFVEATEDGGIGETNITFSPPNVLGINATATANGYRTEQKNTILQGVTISGDGSGNTRGVYFTDAVDVTLRDVRIEYCQNGFSFAVIYGLRIRCENVHIVDSAGARIAGRDGYYDIIHDHPYENSTTHAVRMANAVNNMVWYRASGDYGNYGVRCDTVSWYNQIQTTVNGDRQGSNNSVLVAAGSEENTIRYIIDGSGANVSITANNSSRGV